MFPWGNTFKVKGKYQCNTWQGDFPTSDSGEDGHDGPAPVWTFKQNNFDLHNMVGNVWEWTADWWGVRHTKEFQENPVSEMLITEYPQRRSRIEQRHVPLINKQWINWRHNRKIEGV